MQKWSLKRTKQCAKCPFKVTTNPSVDIPNYNKNKHCNLENTISKDTYNLEGGSFASMACHESTEKEPYHCIGWLHHQLGAGNNVRLRFRMFFCENAKDIRVFGKQHISFNDTIK